MEILGFIVEGWRGREKTQPHSYRITGGRGFATGPVTRIASGEVHRGCALKVRRMTGGGHVCNHPARADAAPRPPNNDSKSVASGATDVASAVALSDCEISTL